MGYTWFVYGKNNPQNNWNKLLQKYVWIPYSTIFVYEFVNLVFVSSSSHWHCLPEIDRGLLYITILQCNSRNFVSFYRMQSKIVWKWLQKEKLEFGHWIKRSYEAKFTLMHKDVFSFNWIITVLSCKGCIYPF